MSVADAIPKGGSFLISEASAKGVFTPEDFTEEQKQLGETVRQFMANEVLPNVEKLEGHDFALMVRLLKRAGELGLLMIEAPEEYGGLALDKATSMVAAEAVSVYGGFATAFSAHTGIGTLPLVYYGTAAQKEKYLGKIITGEWIAAYCLTEPNSGSDALGAKTSAVLSEDGKHYILNGTKQFITNGGFADLYTVFAKVDRERFTAFLVERTFPGVSPGPEEKKLGIKGSSTTPLILEDAMVPVGNVLGEIGKGHKIAFNILNLGRLKLGANVVGGAKAAFAEGVRYANVRRQFGVPIGSFGAIREKIADSAARIFAAESLVYRLAGMIDARLATVDKGDAGYYEKCQQGIEEYAMECAAAKVFCSEMLDRVTDEVVQIHGGYGFIQEYAAERYYRDSRINRIFEGTNEINRILIPGVLLKRAMKGEIQLLPEVMKAVEAMKSPVIEETDPADPFAAEKALLRNLKTVFLVVAGAAVQKHAEKIRDEQEVLMAVADIAIGIFAIESAVLRAARIAGGPGDARRALAAAAVKTFAFGAAEAAASAARKAAFLVEDGKKLARILEGIGRLAKYDASGLLDAKRLLAGASLESEKYVF